jgi:hypothetical protein
MIEDAWILSSTAALTTLDDPEELCKLPKNALAVIQFRSKAS